MAKPKLTRISTVELRRELDRRATHASRLEVKRVELARELKRLDAEISELGGSASAASDGAGDRHSRASSRRARQTIASITRAANKAPLHMAVCSVLKGKTMGVAEVADAVRAVGYRSNAANFRTMVNMTLIKRKDLFRRAGRGKYTAK